MKLADNKKPSLTCLYIPQSPYSGQAKSSGRLSFLFTFFAKNEYLDKNRVFNTVMTYFCEENRDMDDPLDRLVLLLLRPGRKSRPTPANWLRFLDKPRMSSNESRLTLKGEIGFVLPNQSGVAQRPKSDETTHKHEFFALFTHEFAPSAQSCGGF